MKKRLCPICGKNNTAKIFWGLPNMTLELENEIKNKTLVLGGCCLPIPEPSHYCFNCDKNILINFENELFTTTYFKFEEGGFHQGFKTTLLYRKNDKFLIEKTTFYNKEKYEIEEFAFFKALKKIYLSRFLEWNEDYVDMDIMDGHQWSIKVRFSEKSSISNKKSFEVAGSNAYPPFWNKFIKAIASLDDTIYRFY